MNSRWHELLNSNAPLLIESFFERSGVQSLVVCTKEDIYEYDEPGTQLLYLTQRYETGTVDAAVFSAPPRRRFRWAGLCQLNTSGHI